MKKKIVMKVQMNCEECRKKALKAASIEGVSKVEIGGKEQDQVVVEAEGVCPAKLACRLRKKLGNAELITVEEVKPKEEKDPEKEESKGEKYALLQWPTPYYYPYTAVYLET